jgi:hypothetical protein
LGQKLEVTCVKDLGMEQLFDDRAVQVVPNTGKRVDEMAVALRTLVNKLEQVHADPAYQSVWTLAWIHSGQYAGPNYSDELAAAKRALGD